MTVVLFAALTAVFGVGVLPYLVIQAVGRVLRCWRWSTTWSTTACCARSAPDGRYERTRPEHSWNSNNVASNVLLYHLQRHSDHHANPTRRFQALRHFDEAPQLPTGYAGDDPARAGPAAVAPGHGPAAAGALRRRRDAREHPSAGAPARAAPLRSGADEHVVSRRRHGSCCATGSWTPAARAAGRSRRGREVTMAEIAPPPA